MPPLSPLPPSIYAYSGDALLPCSALMAAFGHGAGILERAVVSHAADTAVALLRQQHTPGGGDGPGRIIVRDAAAAGGLPADFRALLQACGLRSLAAAAIAAPGAPAPLGALVLGCREPGVFDATW
jgi:hypothetical protein